MRIDVHRLVVQLEEALGAHAGVHRRMVAVAKPRVRNTVKPVGHLFRVREVVQLHQLTVAVDRLVWEF